MSEYNDYGSTAAAPKPQYTAHVQRFLDDASVPAALKELYLEIIPQKNLARFQALVAGGILKPEMGDCGHLLASPLAQVLSLRDPERTQWLKALFAETRELESLEIALIYNGSWIFSLDRISTTQTSSHVLPFAAYLQTHNGKNIFDIADICPALLNHPVKPNNQVLPLAHMMMHLNPLTIAEFDKLESVCGNADFLTVCDAMGRTMFSNIVAYAGYRDNINMVEIAAWMLQRKPELANMCDRLDFTPLDRYVVSAKAELTDSAMLRLLVSAGGDFNRQLAPRFNLAAEVEKRNDPFTHKIRDIKKPRPPSA